MSPLERFLARLGITPLDRNNELHARLWEALKDTGHETHMERLILTRGVLSRAHEDAALAVGKTRALYETKLRTVKRAQTDAGKSGVAATAVAEAEAQHYRNQMHEAEAWWRGVKEHLRTVDKDIDKTRSDLVDARQMRAAETYGGQP
ncbi:hypothetical protein [Microbacterium sp. YY-01]|uniref:hypothetical protein n=1 Tax=Microbacterium sp. YY-01 TaxID=3421634 RepID=UPI003D17480D